MIASFKIFSRCVDNGQYRLSLRLGTAYGLLSNLHTFLPPKKFRWPRNSSEGYLRVYLVPFEDVLPSIPCYDDIHLWKKGWRSFVEHLQRLYFEDPSRDMTPQLEKVDEVDVPPRYAPYLTVVKERLREIREIRGQVDAVVQELLQQLGDKKIIEITAEGAAAPFAQALGKKLKASTFILNPDRPPQFFQWGCLVQPETIEVLDTGRSSDPRLDQLDYQALWNVKK